MATVSLELSNKPGRDGRHEVMFRITQQRKKSRIGSGFQVTKKSYNSKAKFGQWIRSSELYYDRINKRLQEHYMDMKQFIDVYIKEHPTASAHDIKQAFQGKGGEVTMDWLSYFDKVKISYDEVSKHQFALKLKYIRNKLADYLNKRVVQMDATDLEFMRGFEAYLHQIGNAQNTIDKNIKTLKQLYRKAVLDDLIPNPNFKVLEYKSSTVPVERDKLTQEEIDSIEGLELDRGGPLWHTRNIFLFAFYCAGIRFTDAVTLRWSSIHEGKYLKYRMSKTNKLQNLKFPKKAQEILDYYVNKESNPESFIFPFLSEGFDSEDPIARIRKVSSNNTVVNKNLKLLAKKADIQKVITFHTSRHSFAYIGFKRTKDVVAMQNMLQHSKLKETQDYITSLTNEQGRDILGEIFD